MLGFDEIDKQPDLCFGTKRHRYDADAAHFDTSRNRLRRARDKTAILHRYADLIVGYERRIEILRRFMDKAQG